MRMQAFKPVESLANVVAPTFLDITIGVDFHMKNQKHWTEQTDLFYLSPFILYGYGHMGNVRLIGLNFIEKCYLRKRRSLRALNQRL